MKKNQENDHGFDQMPDVKKHVAYIAVYEAKMTWIWLVCEYLVREGSISCNPLKDRNQCPDISMDQCAGMMRKLGYRIREKWSVKGLEIALMKGGKARFGTAFDLKFTLIGGVRNSASISEIRIGFET